jgi:hypothetical protein
MAQLIMTNQQKYAPSNMINDVPDILMEVPMHGDQLFEERCRNVQWTFQDGTSKYDRLEGITTEAADWHAKVNLYNVCLLEDKFEFFHTQLPGAGPTFTSKIDWCQTVLVFEDTQP